MLAITRLNAIKEIIRQQKSVLVSELAPRFDVTEETIRRDLKKLEDEGLVTRVYGGAYSTGGVQNDVNISLRQTILVDEKRAIARRCLPSITNGDSIFLDCSTTVLELAQLLTQYSLTVITNSLKVADCLAPCNDIRLILVGGTLHHTSMSFLGQGTCAALGNYYVDKAFVSCRSLDMKHGITDSNEEQSVLRRVAIRSSNQVFLLADHTKFDTTSFSTIATLEEIGTLVTDRPLTPEWQAYMKDKGFAYIDADTP